jgi:hypothetical protein
MTSLCICLSTSAPTEWKLLVLAKRLALCLSPGQLRLSIICESLESYIMKEVTESILELPLLKERTIRLGPNRNTYGQSIAERVVSKMTDTPSQWLGRPFMFDDLPEETQSSILRHGDLVYSEPLECIFNPYRGIVEFINHGCCGICTDTHEYCCCPLQHAAADTSRFCSCWKLSLGIFLVSKKFYDYCTKLLFSSKPFKILPPPGSPHRSLLVPDPILCFPKHPLRYIQRLHLRVDIRQQPSPGDRAW